MKSEELMQNNWVKLYGLPVPCKVRSITPSTVVVEITSGGSSEQKADRLSPIELTDEFIIRAKFHKVKKGVYQKSVRDTATFTYETDCRKLTVESKADNFTNVHVVCFVHELQQMYYYYIGKNLEFDMTKASDVLRFNK